MDTIRSKERGAALDWETRLNFFEGITHGLVYCHHDYVPLIIHRNLKVRNVLLDGDMETHTADFGTAKKIAFKPNDDYVNTTILVDGTYEYIAPNKYELRYA